MKGISAFYCYIALFTVNALFSTRFEALLLVLCCGALSNVFSYV